MERRKLGFAGPEAGPQEGLQLGRTQRPMCNNASARKSYEEFLNIWKDADPDIPIYRQAKTESAEPCTSLNRAG